MKKTKTLVFLSSLLSFYFVIRGFGELLFSKYLTNNIVGIFSLFFSLIYIYLIDNLKLRIRGKLKFPFVTFQLNLLMITSAMAIAINLLILFGIKSVENFVGIYFLLIFIESFTLLSIVNKLKILIFIPHMKEFLKWTRYSTYATLTIFLYPLAMVLFGFSLYTMGKLFNTIDKIKVNVRESD